MPLAWTAVQQNLSALSSDLIQRIGAHLPQDSYSLKGVTVPTLAAPFLLALLVLLRVGIVGARPSKMEYTVKWNRERLRFPLPPLETPLGQLRAQVTEYTQLPAGSFKLVHAGAVMKDDTQPISAYGIRANSTLAIIGSDAPPPRREEAPAARTEANTITAIQAVLSSVRDGLLPDVERFVGGLSDTELGSITPAQESEHRRLGELLLQALLRLDALAAEGEWADARAARRGAVREVQGVLDRLDERWKDAKAAQAART